MPGIKSGPRAGQGESSKYLLSCLTVVYLEPLVPWEKPGEQQCLEQAGAHYLVRTYSQDVPGLADPKTALVN